MSGLSARVVTGSLALLLGGGTLALALPGGNGHAPHNFTPTSRIAPQHPTPTHPASAEPSVARPSAAEPSVAARPTSE